ncbi:MAG: N-6 DNA methylase [Candidatus Lokiarchaeota archaeon]
MNNNEIFKEITKSYNEVFLSNNFERFNQLKENLNKLIDRFIDSYPKRKKEGVYYTENKIAEFMAKEAIIFLINKKLMKCYRNFKHINCIKDIYDLPFLIKKKVKDLLLNAKICDPAMGAGIFLVSLYKLIVDILLNLKNESFNNSDYYIDVISNIYGYDINKYAIQLARLNLLVHFLGCSNSINLNLRKVLSLYKINLQLKNVLIAGEKETQKINEDNQFDIIISNPPYGNILDDKSKEILKANNTFYNDIYCTFLIKSLDWTKSGVHLYLIPKSFLLRQNYVGFRKRFLERCNLLKIFDLGSNIFKSATNEVQILIFENKSTNLERDLQIYDYPEKFVSSYPNQVFDNLYRCSNKNCPLLNKAKNFYAYSIKKSCQFCNGKTEPLNRIRIKTTDKIFSILQKIEKKSDLNYLNVNKFPKLIRGEEAKGLKAVKLNLQDNLRNSCYFINAKKDLSYYYFQKRKSFQIEKVSPKVLKGNDYEFYLDPKLLIKHNNIVPETVFTPDNVCFTSSIYSLIYRDEDELKYLCGCLNSLPIQFYCYFGINNQKDTTINLNQYMIRHLPIPNISTEKKLMIASLVDDIISNLKGTKNIINQKIVLKLKEIDSYFIKYYAFSEQDKKVMIKEIKSRIDYFNKLYS